MTRKDFLESGKRFLSFSHWRKRLVFWCGAVAVGVIAAGFAYVADDAQKVFLAFYKASHLLPLVISPLFMALSAWLTARFAPGAVGSGIPQAIAARGMQKSEDRMKLLGPKIIFGKGLFLVLALIGGASVGREGPTVQIGAAIMYLGALFAGISSEMAPSFILAGAAAGVAAAFNTPLAGIVFAIEEMARAFEHRYSGVVLTAIVLAGAASLSILGNYTYFGYADGGFSIARDWLPVVVIGVGGGVLGALFARLLAEGGPRLFAILKNSRFIHPVGFAAICGLCIALLGLLTHGQTYGSGYDQAREYLSGDTAGSGLFVVTKFLATAISGFSGIPGGIFSPSLSVGAALGAMAAPWFSHSPIAGMVLLGMAAYFSGVTQAPITSFVIVLEVTGRESLPVPLLAAALIAAAVSRIICPVSLYHMLAKTFIVHTQKPANEANEAVVA